jgi:hypothetical protein
MGFNYSVCVKLFLKKNGWFLGMPLSTKCCVNNGGWDLAKSFGIWQKVCCKKGNTSEKLLGGSVWW